LKRYDHFLQLLLVELIPPDALAGSQARAGRCGTQEESGLLDPDIFGFMIFIGLTELQDPVLMDAEE